MVKAPRKGARSTKGLDWNELDDQARGKDYFFKGAYSEYRTGLRRTEINKQIAADLERGYSFSKIKNPDLTIVSLNDEVENLKKQVASLQEQNCFLRKQNTHYEELLTDPQLLWEYIEAKMKHEIAAERAKGVRKKRKKKNRLGRATDCKLEDIS